MTTFISEQAKAHEEELRQRREKAKQREEELKQTPHRPPDPATWPNGVRSISIGEADALGVDANGELYWHGKPVEIRRPLVLSKAQAAFAILVSVFAILGAVGSMAQGWASYHEWSCKTGYRSWACPPK